MKLPDLFATGDISTPETGIVMANFRNWTVLIFDDFLKLFHARNIKIQQCLRISLQCMQIPLFETCEVSAKIRSSVQMRYVLQHGSYT